MGDLFQLFEDGKIVDAVEIRKLLDESEDNE